MGEVWKDIDGYEGIYQISSFGRVKSLDRYVRTAQGTRMTKGVILTPDKSSLYERATLCNQGEMKKFSIHRLVAHAFIPNTYNKPQVNHINGTKNDNRVENLQWCTSHENLIHAFKVGLKTNNAHKIKVTFDNGQTFDSITECARYLNVSRSTVRDIIKNDRVYNGRKIKKYSEDE